MPLYDFKCTKCKEVFEVFQSWDYVEVFCPKCNSNELTRVPVAASLRFNGSGFYKEGFSSKK